MEEVGGISLLDLFFTKLSLEGECLYYGQAGLMGNSCCPVASLPCIC